MDTHEDIGTLVAAIQAGEVHRYAEVVRRYDARVRTLVARMVWDEGIREELVQHVFYVAFKSFGGLATGASLGAWLESIARNAVADHFRAARIPATPLPGQPEAPVLAHDWIWDEVDALDVVSRDVLRLRYRDGCSYAEIAEHLRVPLSTVRGRIHEARKALRARLERGDRR
jgi:RNA polymerase sigma-70 factor (ECF subfamily)